MNTVFDIEMQQGSIEYLPKRSRYYQGMIDLKIAKKLDELVQKARQHKEWRLEYMTLLERDEQMREEGRKEGREEERINTMKEAARADAAEAAVLAMQERIQQLEKKLASLTGT